MVKVIWNYIKAMSLTLSLHLVRFLPLYIGVNGLIVFLYFFFTKNQSHFWLLAIAISFLIIGIFTLKRMTTDKEYRNLSAGMEGLVLIMTLPTIGGLWLFQHFSE